MPSKPKIKQVVLAKAGIAAPQSDTSLTKDELITIFNALAADGVSVAADEITVPALKQSISTACDFDYAPQTGETASGVPIVRSQNNRAFRKAELASIRDALDADD